MGSPAGISLGLFVLLVLGSVAGMLLPPRLPHGHRGQETRQVVQIGATMLVTLTAVVLGLLLASVKAEFDQTGADVQVLGREIILLDQSLQQIGPTALPARALLRRYTAQALAETWPINGDPELVDSASSWSILLDLSTAVRALDAATPDGPLAISAREAWRRDAELERVRWRIVGEAVPTISIPLLLVLGFWLFLGFFAFGFGAPVNAFVFCASVLLAFAITLSVFVILELDGAFSGLIVVSNAPVRTALALLGP